MKRGDLEDNEEIDQLIRWRS